MTASPLTLNNFKILSVSIIFANPENPNNKNKTFQRFKVPLLENEIKSLFALRKEILQS